MGVFLLFLVEGYGASPKTCGKEDKTRDPINKETPRITHKHDQFSLVIDTPKKYHA